jgi:AmmeMemoRadiSam system protein B
LIDPSGIAPNGVTLSETALFIVSLMDGRHRRADIQAEFMRRHGRLLFSDELDAMIGQLDRGLFLEGPAFDGHVAELTRRYREGPCRPLRDAEALGAPPSELGAYLDDMLAKGVGSPAGKGSVIGLIAPHLDYQRGGPCYGAAYRGLCDRSDATRFVVLGTNHFGLSRAVVGTRKGYETPFGVVPCDEAFTDRVDRRCGRNLCAMEYDHAREHSIELQVVLLKHVLDGRQFSIAPYLCPDACGPTGTSPWDGQGVDLRDFALALRKAIAEDDVPTCVIAGADLSHVGRSFQDDRDLIPEELKKVEASDRAALSRVLACDADGFRELVADAGNQTSICSTGCIYAATVAMAGRSRPRLLAYHQALTRQAENCVTCAAVEFVAE